MKHAEFFPFDRFLEGHVSQNLFKTNLDGSVLPPKFVFICSVLTMCKYERNRHKAASVLLFCLFQPKKGAISLIDAPPNLKLSSGKSSV